MNPVTHILDGAITPHNQRLAKVGVVPLPLGVNPDQVQLLPAPVNHILDAEVQLARHDNRVGLAGELVEEVKGDGVDLIVDVEALDVLAVVGHDDVDEVVDGTVLVSDEDFAVEDLVVAEDVHDHFFVDSFGGGLEGDFHAAGFFGFEVDVTRDGGLVGEGEEMGRKGVRRFTVESDAYGLQLCFEKGALFGSLGGVEDHEDEITGFGGGDDLAAAAFAFGGTFDDTG